MKPGRCPYHVKQGFVDTEGKLMLSDICGVKAACGEGCSYFPFQDGTYKTCPRLVAHQRGGEKHVLIPKDDLEYLPELGGLSSISELELM